MTLSGSRFDVMQFVGERIDTVLGNFLKPIDDNWQPADFLPDSTQESFLADVKEFRESARELPYDYVAVLVGDTITEEALPTYES